jgi:aspartyl protease family protein
MKEMTLATIALLACSLISSDLWGDLRNQAIAQESSGCFMINSKGRRINLGRLCNSSPNQTAPTQSRPTAIPSQAAIETNGTVKVPIKRRVGGIPIIDVTFNGDRVYEMMLDTGASRTLITSEMAQSLNVTPYNTADFEIADGSTVKFPVGELKSVELGSIKVQLMPVPIAVKSNMGLLGQDFFGTLDIKISQNVIELSPRKFF